MGRRVEQVAPNTIKKSEYLRLCTELVNAQREISDRTEYLAAARGVKAGILKRAKSLGADVDAMRMLATLSGLDESARVLQMEALARYAGWQEVRLWRGGDADAPQGTMFEIAAEEGADTPEAMQAAGDHHDAQVNADGYNSRKGGATLDDNPHAAGSRDHQTWASSWYDADRDLGAAPSETARASAKPRGRPRRVIPAPALQH